MHNCTFLSQFNSINEQYPAFDWPKLSGFQILLLQKFFTISGDAEELNRQPGDIVSREKSKLTFGRFVKGKLFKRKLYFLTLSLRV
jgi:hypothetical protein